MVTTQKIAKAVGRANMAKALGVGSTAVSNAVVSGKFPPAWFVVMQRLCAGADIDCPPSLFSMKSTVGVLPEGDTLTFQGKSAQKVNEARQ